MNYDISARIFRVCLILISTIYSNHSEKKMCNLFFSICILYLFSLRHINCLENLVIDEPNFIVNRYAFVAYPIKSGTKQIGVDLTSDFESNDMAMLIQVQNGDSKSVGHFEFVEIAEVNTFGYITSVVLQRPVIHDYNSGSPNLAKSFTTQLIKVPKYLNVTILENSSISAPKWNGKIGGVVVFHCHYLDGPGIIDVSEAGFRGGFYGRDDNDPGYEGEGIYGGGPDVNGKVSGISGILVNGAISPVGRNTGGAGGEGASHTGVSGGGGGHKYHGTSGRCNSFLHEMKGGFPAPISVSQVDRIFFGGGGGGGGDDDNLWNYGFGGNGGGIAMIKAKKISNLNISANGESTSQYSQFSPSNLEHYSLGGGGAGGTILVSSDEFFNVNLQSDGGIGIQPNGENHLSGNGSVGIVHKIHSLVENIQCQDRYALSVGTCCTAGYTYLDSSGFDGYGLCCMVSNSFNSSNSNSEICENSIQLCLENETPVNNGCSSCPYGTFKSVVSNASCILCPDGAFCSNGNFRCTDGYFLYEGKCIPSYMEKSFIQPYTGPVSSIVVKDTYVFAAYSTQKKVVKFEISESKLTKIGEYTSEFIIKSFDIIGESIFVGGDSINLIELSSADFTVLSSVHGLSKAVYIKSFNETLFVSFQNNTIRQLDTSTRDTLNIFDDGQQITTFEFNSINLFTGSSNGLISIWDIKFAQKLAYYYIGQNFAVNALWINDL